MFFVDVKCVYFLFLTTCWSLYHFITCACVSSPLLENCWNASAWQFIMKNILNKTMLAHLQIICEFFLRDIYEIQICKCYQIDDSYFALCIYIDACHIVAYTWLINKDIMALPVLLCLPVLWHVRNQARFEPISSVRHAREFCELWLLVIKPLFFPSG